MIKVGITGGIGSGKSYICKKCKNKKRLETNLKTAQKYFLRWHKILEDIPIILTMISRNIYRIENENFEIVFNMNVKNNKTHTNKITIFKDNVIYHFENILPEDFNYYILLK